MFVHNFFHLAYPPGSLGSFSPSIRDALDRIPFAWTMLLAWWRRSWAFVCLEVLVGIAWAVLWLYVEHWLLDVWMSSSLGESVSDGWLFRLLSFADSRRIFFISKPIAENELEPARILSRFCWPVHMVHKRPGNTGNCRRQVDKGVVLIREVPQIIF